MIRVIRVNKAGNRIKSYACTDGKETVEVTKDKLSELIRNKEVCNATQQLYKGSIIIRIKEVDAGKTDGVGRQEQKNRIDKVNDIKAVMGATKRIKLRDGFAIYTEKDGITVVHIPDQMEQAGFEHSEEWIQFIHSHRSIKVTGGNSLKSTREMFANCTADFIDLSSFNTCSVTDMEGMFCSCRAKIIKLDNLDTHNVLDMSNMFKMCEASTLDLTSFNTRNVQYMGRMFYYFQGVLIDLDSFVIRNVIEKREIFFACKARVYATDYKIREWLKNRRF